MEWLAARRRSSKKPPVLFAIISILVVAGFLGIFLFNGASTVISPLAEDVKINLPTKILNIPAKKVSDPKELLLEIKDLAQKNAGVYSVYIFDLNKNTGFGINESTIFTAASVNKIPVLAALYYEAQKGTIDLDRRITLQASDIQDFGTGTLRYQGPGGVYSLKTLAQLMMEKSDNTAVYVLITVIGESRIQTLVNSWGLTQTDIKNNKTSPLDMALLLTKMYKRQIANEALTAEMIGFMDGSDFENRLPALLPKDVKVFHKIGNEIGNVHDVGIIDLPKHPYIISVMTNDVVDEPTTESTIAQISKITFDFMKNL